MLSNKYLQIWVDGSWILSRNLFVISAGKEAGSYTSGELLRLTIQSIAKLSNQLGVTADKIHIIWDRWKKEYGGYYRTFLLSDSGYKDDRVYIDNLYVEQLREKEGVTEKEIKEAENEAYRNKIKMEAKYTIIKEFENFGFTNIFYEGLEFDDLAVIASMMYSSGDITGRKKCCIVTKDSDMLRAVSPCVDFYKYGKKTDPAVIWTYDEVVATVPQNLRDAGLTPYWYYCLLEALGGGHNAVKSPRKKGSHLSKVIEDIVLHNDYSAIEDKELFDKSMQSFDFSTYPMINDIQEMITNQFMTKGRIGTLSEFRTFCDKYGVDGISDSYFANFVSRLDRSMYCDPAPEQQKFL